MAIDSFYGVDQQGFLLNNQLQPGAGIVPPNNDDNVLENDDGWNDINQGNIPPNHNPNAYFINGNYTFGMLYNPITHNFLLNNVANRNRNNLYGTWAQFKYQGQNVGPAPLLGQGVIPVYNEANKQGHLVNAELGGVGRNYNLTPISTSLNREHANFERTIQILAGVNATRGFINANAQNYFIYRVHALMPNTQNNNLLPYPNGIVLSLGIWQGGNLLTHNQSIAALNNPNIFNQNMRQVDMDRLNQMLGGHAIFYQ